MEVENISSSSITSVNKDGEDGVPLPGFRFHPTDEELVGFYLRRKVEKKSISIELIKQADIYKYDPWDLPKSGTVGDKEWYFFCKRGRKYRNSIRPNRVTGSGFWKATGIDRPIYSSGSGHEARDCIGLKKSLVYYRGSAGKGTKTDWMMHEFRLPASHDNMQTTKHIDHVKTAVNNTQLEAEVWTLCRIFKRNVSYRKCVPDWREIAAGKKSTTITSCNASCSSKTCSTDSSDFNNQSSYIRFNNAPIISQIERKPYIAMHAQTSIANQQATQLGHYFSSPVISSADSSISSNNIMCADVNDFLKHADWEDLRSIVDYNAASIAPTNNINPFYI